MLKKKKKTKPKKKKKQKNKQTKITHHNLVKPCEPRFHLMAIFHKIKFNHYHFCSGFLQFSFAIKITMLSIKMNKKSPMKSSKL